MRRSLDWQPDLAQLDGARDRTLIDDVVIRVVTPMFGGGVEAGKVDVDHPLSAKAIRGHLRFWWRACQGARFHSAEALFNAEEALWGSTEKPALVKCQIEVTAKDHPVPCATYKPHRQRHGELNTTPEFREGYPGYALFPYSGKASKHSVVTPASEAIENIVFTLRLSLNSYPTNISRDTIRQGVESALWAWINFGGIGSRTRRGCGSLFSDRFSTTTIEKLLADAERHITRPEGQCPLIPAPLLFDSSFIAPGAPTPVKHTQAWCNAVKVMQDFRQQVGTGRVASTRHPGRPGRSLWPEPDSIRDLTRCIRGVHSPEHLARPFFPRADLGLPIIFHFINDKDDRDTYPPEPDDATLEGGQHNQKRMASPIILKPLATSETTSIPFILLLRAPHVWDSCSPGVVVRSKQISHGKHELQEDDLHGVKATQVEPMVKELPSAENARDAFMAYAAVSLGGTTMTLCGAKEVALP